MEPFDPPFRSFYKKLFDTHLINNGPSSKCNEIDQALQESSCEFELPLIDLSRLNQDGDDCKREIAEAAQEWGFFQVVNHGVSSEILEKMRCEQVKAFKKPFQEKVNGLREFDFLAGNYRWGTPSATCLRQLAWSEAFHVPLTEISTMGGATSFSTTMNQYAKIVSKLAEKVAEILAEKLGQKPGFFKEKCVPSMCYIRMSRYPFCPISPQVFGLMPHTDSDFLTILHQDHVGGLQLLRNGKWIAVNPKQETLIVIIGDLFQVTSSELEPWRDMIGTIVMVTGASSGIGWEFYIDLAKSGCRIIAAAHRIYRLKALCDEINNLCISDGHPNRVQSRNNEVLTVAVQLDVSADGRTIEASARKLGTRLVVFML